MIQHEIQKAILSECSFYSSGATFSQLKPKDENLENDKFNYHLQYLVKNNYLIKKNNKYILTEFGKSVVTNIDHISKEISTNYKVGVYISIIKDNKILLYKRLKHPQYGYTGLISGKITYGETILDTAERELREETGLVANDFKIIGAFRQIRKNLNNDVIEDGIFFVCYTDKFLGESVKNNREGEYFWAELDIVANIEKIFKPSLEIIIKEIQKRQKGEISWDTKFIYELQPEPEEY